MKPTRLAKALLRRAPICWTLLVIGSAFLVAATALPFTKPETADLVAARHVTTCAHIGSVASRYIDREACRRARKEVLRSLKASRDPDWGDVVRDSIPPASKRPGRHSKSKHPDHESRKQPVTETPTPRPTSEATKTPPTTEQPSEQAEPSTPPRTPMRTEEDAPRPTEPAKLNGYTSELADWAGIAILFALAGGAAVYVAKRRRAVIRAMHAVLCRIDRKARRKTRPSPMTPSRSLVYDGRRIALTSNVVSLAGPGAEDAVRRLVLDALTDRPNDAVEVVIARPDAWRLLGTDIGTLQQEKIPGLTLAEDAQELRTYLEKQGLSRRLLVTYDGGLEDLRELRSVQHGHLTVVSLAACSETSIKISADGETTPGTAASPIPDRLPLVSRADAFSRLMSMPTLTRHREG